MFKLTRKARIEKTLSDLGAKQLEHRYWNEHTEFVVSPIPNIIWPQSTPDSIKFLWELRDTGVAIRNWIPRNEEGFIRWKAHVTEWLARFEQCAKLPKFPPGLFHYIYTLNEIVGPCPVADTRNKLYSLEHALECRSMSEHLRRLESFLLNRIYFREEVVG